MPGTYAQTTYGDTQFEDFSVIADLDGKQQEYRIVKMQPVSIGFSSEWENGPSQLVQQMIMEKEAHALLLWSDFTQFALQVRVQQGTKFYTSGRVDPTLPQIQEAIGREFYNNIPEAHSLYDYAGYLAIMPQVEAIMSSTNREAQDMLGETNIPAIWRMAKEKNIVFIHPIGSRAFIRQAYDPKSPWGEIILNGK